MSQNKNNEQKTKQKKKLWPALVAGALAGTLEHCVMYPVDVIKTRVQLATTETSLSNSTIRSTFRNIVQKESLFTFYRGISAVVAGAAPAHAVYFGVYEFSKDTLIKMTDKSQKNASWLVGTAGVLATVMHDSLITPCEVVKQRLQMDNFKYKNVTQCIKCIYKTEGAGSFVRSLPVQLVMNVPHNTINFLVYEKIKKEYFSAAKAHGMEEYDYEHSYSNVFVHLFAGSVAGGTAAALTTPFDVVKTRLNTQKVCSEKKVHTACSCVNAELVKNPVPLRNSLEAMRFIYRENGMLGFCRGMVARVVFSAPSYAICWAVYEAAKKFFHTERF